MIFICLILVVFIRIRKIIIGPGEWNMIDPKIKGKIALIKGANHGIGAATAKALAEQGAKVL